MSFFALADLWLIAVSTGCFPKEESGLQFLASPLLARVCCKLSSCCIPCHVVISYKPELQKSEIIVQDDSVGVFKRRERRGFDSAKHEM